MKNTILISLLLIITSVIYAQQVDIEGDTKIVGKINIINAIADSSVFIGANAGKNDDGENRNTFVGVNAGKSNTSGYYNSFFGKDAGASTTMGVQNSFFGQDAGLSNTTGDFNSFFGQEAGYLNKTGNSNSFFGRGAGYDNTGDFNSFFGVNAGGSNTTGGYNSFFGQSAGNLHNNTSTTLIGHDAETTSSLNRAIAIGHGAKVGCHNCAVIGGTGLDAVNVGISVEQPVTKLHILGGIDASLTDHGYLVNGPIDGLNLVIDNNEIIARDNGQVSPLYLNANGGNVGIGVTGPPATKLHIIGGTDASLSNHGYLVNGSIGDFNLVIDNNEIIARNDGLEAPLYLNAGSGNVAIGATPTPTAKLDVVGNVRIRTMNTVSGIPVIPVVIDSDGNLYRSSSSSSKSQDPAALLSIQNNAKQSEDNKKEIENTRLIQDRKIKMQNERITQLENTVSELKQLYQQLLIEIGEK